jgi:hypothetical protein
LIRAAASTQTLGIFFMAKQRHIWAMAVLTMLLVCAPPVFACECEPPSQQNVFNHSSAVFIGEVLDIADSEVPLFKDLKPAPKSSYAVTFKVIEYWKGVRSSQIVVHSDLGGLPCHQFAFRKGEKYLVYAEGKNLVAITGCTRSRIVENTEYYRSELRGLGPAKKPKLRV